MNIRMLFQKHFQPIVTSTSLQWGSWQYVLCVFYAYYLSEALKTSLVAPTLNRGQRNLGAGGIFFACQSNLFQPRGQIMPTTLLLAPHPSMDLTTQILVASAGPAQRPYGRLTGLHIKSKKIPPLSTKLL